MCELGLKPHNHEVKTIAPERLQNSDFQSHFSLLKINEIFLIYFSLIYIGRKNFIHKMFWKLWFSKYFNVPNFSTSCIYDFMPNLHKKFEWYLTFCHRGCQRWVWGIFTCSSTHFSLYLMIILYSPCLVFSKPFFFFQLCLVLTLVK